MIIDDSILICPHCGQKLVKGKSNIFCSDYKLGCKLSIPYILCGKNLTSSQISMLIASGRTHVIKGFVGKSGKEFNASLKINNKGQIEFVFSKSTK